MTLAVERGVKQKINLFSSGGHKLMTRLYVLPENHVVSRKGKL